MSKALRIHRLTIPVLLYEKKQVDRKAKEANLNTTDFVRLKLGLPQARGKRTDRKREELESPLGDPENAVDVEELARKIYDGVDQRVVDPMVMTMAEARREARRRLEDGRA